MLREYHVDRDDIPGTGGQLAEHLLDQLEVKDVQIFASQNEDYFDPEHKIIALSGTYFHGKTLTSIAVAAHELGHLIQYKQDSRLLTWRIQMQKMIIRFSPISSAAILIFPILAVVTKSPLVIILLIGAGVFSKVMEVTVQLLALPVELDASFGKALPILKNGGFITKADEPAVRKILTACALTYLASALNSLLSLGRLLKGFRR